MARVMLSAIEPLAAFDLHQQEMMQSQLQRVRGSGDLSADLFEVLEKSLAV